MQTRSTYFCSRAEENKLLLACVVLRPLNIKRNEFFAWSHQIERIKPSDILRTSTIPQLYYLRIESKSGANDLTTSSAELQKNFFFLGLSKQSSTLHQRNPEETWFHNGRGTKSTRSEQQQQQQEEHTEDDQERSGRGVGTGRVGRRPHRRALRRPSRRWCRAQGGEARWGTPPGRGGEREREREFRVQTGWGEGRKGDRWRGAGAILANFHRFSHPFIIFFES